MTTEFNLNEVEVGFAAAGDREKVIGLFDEITVHIRASGTTWKNYRLKADISAKRDAFAQIVRGEGRIFVARYRGEVIGAVNVQFIHNIRHGGKRAQIEECVVTEDRRRRGVGSLLLAAIKDYCLEQRVYVIKLLCGKQLKEARRFYEKNGFVANDKGYRFAIIL